MNAAVREAVDRLAAAHHDGRHLLLLFDYDGTLVPIAEHPRMARLSAAVRRQLERLAAVTSVNVGVVSGRAIADLRDCVRLADVFYVGTSGLELAFGETTVTHPDADRGAALVGGAAARIRLALANDEAAWLELKPLGLTVHYRGVTAARVESLKADVAAAIESGGQSFRILDGPMAIEITPALGWTKESALRMLRARVGNDALPFYAGDDKNDADAMAAAAALGGVTIGIGARAPAAAQYRLPDPAALARVLDNLLDMLVSGGQLQ